ncbi:MAG: DUF4387 domain-containing protein [Acetomicrobium sp.]|jgi:hypothetical protein|uniref:DUF4387 domain-containing protein n=1 Tax=Acetomicrobium sp. TaxID=1872099 RepID=UPI002B25C6A9|nr:DUF4387 domain-containing protein [Acetomicrobium sp.]HOM97357.1 DUF4387 domain-containing protein [Acetomicrobium sp.]HPT64748.1 DUF4387 domain-containing protein [Acetomicrobium sp.]
MSKTVSLYDLAKVLRSKNAGPFELTLDVIFESKESYFLVKNSGVITKELICKLYNVKEEDVFHLVFFDQALAFKVTMKRHVDSGSVGDTDVYGAQQHAPLMKISIPVKE